MGFASILKQVYKRVEKEKLIELERIERARLAKEKLDKIN